MPTSQELEAQYSALRAGRTPISQTRSELETKYGLPERRANLQSITKSIYDTSKLLENVEGDVASRATQLGGPVTEAARRRLTSATQAPIQSTISRLSASQARENVGMNELESAVAQNIQDILTSQASEDQDFLARIERQMQREALAQQEALSRASLAQANQGISAADIAALYNTMTSQDKQSAAAKAKVRQLVASALNPLKNSLGALSKYRSTAPTTTRKSTVSSMFDLGTQSLLDTAKKYSGYDTLSNTYNNLFK